MSFCLIAFLFYMVKMMLKFRLARFLYQGVRLQRVLGSAKLFRIR